MVCHNVEFEAHLAKCDTVAFPDGVDLTFHTLDSNGAESLQVAPLALDSITESSHAIAPAPVASEV